MSCHTCDSQLPVVFSMQHAKQEVCTGIVSCSVSCFPGGGGRESRGGLCISHMLDSGCHCLGLHCKQSLNNQLCWAQMSSQHVTLSMFPLLFMFAPFFDRLKGLDQMV